LYGADAEVMDICLSFSSRAGGVSRVHFGGLLSSQNPPSLFEIIVEILPLLSPNTLALTMAHLLSQLNPVPFFPPYTGPYKVGTLDIEIPITDLPSPSPAPDPKISTVHFRIFYPCESPQKSSKSTYWIPEPQREYLGAYARFLGASPTFSEVFS